MTICTTSIDLGILLHQCSICLHLEYNLDRQFGILDRTAILEQKVLFDRTDSPDPKECQGLKVWVDQMECPDLKVWVDQKECPDLKVWLDQMQYIDQTHYLEQMGKPIGKDVGKPAVYQVMVVTVIQDTPQDYHLQYTYHLSRVNCWTRVTTLLRLRYLHSSLLLYVAIAT